MTNEEQIEYGNGSFAYNLSVRDHIAYYVSFTFGDALVALGVHVDDPTSVKHYFSDERLRGDVTKQLVKMKFQYADEFLRQSHGVRVDDTLSLFNES